MSQIKVGDRVQSISGGGSIGTVKAVDDREAWVLFAHNRDHTTRFLSDITSLPPEPKYKAGDRVCDKYSRQNTGKILASHQGETAIWYWVEYESGNCWGKREDELHRADCCK